MGAMTKVCLAACMAVLLVHAAVGARATPKAPFEKKAKKVFNEYIVQVDPDVDVKEVIRSVEGLKAGWAKATRHYLLGDLRGFALKVLDATDAETLPEFTRLLEHPEVLLVEEDGIVTIDQQANPPSWGLDRIDQRDRPLSKTYTYTGVGTGVCVFVVDTGIKIGHVEWAPITGSTSRLIGGRSFVPQALISAYDDDNGHGSHCAGVIGGKTFGVAKNVSLVSAKVFSGSNGAATSTIIEAITWAANFTHTLPQCKQRVISMSLGSGKSTSLNTAVAKAVVAGAVVVVAAGNENQNACNKSPASEPTVITVGATEVNDNRASYSNYGSCLDIFAPGSSITSAWYTSTTANATISGTSMATPHVSGVAALVLQKLGAVTPSVVRNTIVTQSTSNRVVGPGTGSPNKLLFSLIV